MEEPLNVTEPSMSTESATAHRADGMPVRATPAPASERPPLDVARRVVELAEDKKAADIVLLDLSGLTTMADYFVICSGGSERQLGAIADGIIGGLRDERTKAIGKEGRRRRTGSCSTSGQSSSTSSRRRSASTTASRSTGPRRRRSSGSSSAPGEAPRNHRVASRMRVRGTCGSCRR